jgi:hypothetical protein
MTSVKHSRSRSTSASLRQEGAGVVWVGFHGWAFDGQDAQMQAALAVRHSALKAKVRHIPAATDAEMRPTDRRLLQPEKARRERDELLAKIHEDSSHMLDTSRTALGGASPKQRQIGPGARSATTGGPAASAWAPIDTSPGPRVSKAPPGFDRGAGTTKKKRLFGR